MEDKKHLIIEGLEEIRLISKNESKKINIFIVFKGCKLKE